MQQTFSKELTPTVWCIIPTLEFLIKRWESMAKQPRFHDVKDVITHGVQNMKKWYRKVDNTSSAYFICLGASHLFTWALVSLLKPLKFQIQTLRIFTVVTVGSQINMLQGWQNWKKWYVLVLLHCCIRLTGIGLITLSSMSTMFHRKGAKMRICCCSLCCVRASLQSPCRVLWSCVLHSTSSVIVS